MVPLGLAARDTAGTPEAESGRRQGHLMGIDRQGQRLEEHADGAPFERSRVGVSTASESWHCRRFARAAAC